MSLPTVREIERWNERTDSFANAPLPPSSDATVLCGGPSSVLFNDLRLTGKALICVNRMTHPAAQYHVAPSADIILAVLDKTSDSTVIVTTSQIFSTESRGALAKLESARRFIALRTNANCFVKFKAREPISLCDYEAIDLSEAPYLPGASAGVLATAFALALGAKTVRQFGMDGWTQFVRRGSSPYADGTDWAFAERGDEMMDYQESLVMKGLQRCAEFARQRGSQIINMNPESSYQAVLGNVVGQ